MENTFTFKKNEYQHLALSLSEVVGVGASGKHCFLPLLCSFTDVFCNAIPPLFWVSK